MVCEQHTIYSNEGIMTSNIFKKLEWKQTSEDYWIAYTPASSIKGGYIAIAYEQGKYWPIWNCDLPGYKTLEEVQEQGQLYHEQFLTIYINEEYL